MNIELRFLQKAIEDKNYISFTYENRKLSKIKPLELIAEEGGYILKAGKVFYAFKKISKLKINKEKF